MDAGLKRELEAKVYAGERLNREDGIALYESDDLAWLGRLAHHKRTEMNGDRVTFSINRLLNLAYPADVEEAVREAEGPEGARFTELRLVNGRHPDRPWSYYPTVLRALKAALPGVSLQGFTATDVRWFEEISGRPADEILDELTAAGLESLTGDDGEIRPSHWEDWSRIHRLAHAKGMRTPATMLYGQGEEPRHRVDHVLRLRELQDETGGFAVFSPLRHQPGSGDGQESTTVAAPAESLKTFAVSRLMFDNVPHVSCSWASHGLPIAQLSLNFGADDLDGSVVENEVTDDDLLTLIWDAGLRPVERDSRYEVVREHDAAPSFADRRSEPQQVWA
jgi:aminodeoxyfutalosine synthase